MPWGALAMDKRMEGAPSGLIEQNITRHLLNEKVLAGDECRARNDRQTYFSLARELVTAQFVLADHELTRRLWQEVSDRNLDMGRIINLLYCCSGHEDENEMVEVDNAFLQLTVS